MNEAQRPTKKQRELLSFIDGFIKGNGYGPSYREVMRALEYKSVSTVATHIDGLIARGYLRKKDNSARTLEVMTTDIQSLPKEDDDAVLRARFHTHIQELQQVPSDENEQCILLLKQAAEILHIDLSNN